MTKPASHVKGTYRRDLFNALEECHMAVCVSYPRWLESLDKLAEVRARRPTVTDCRLSTAVDDYLKKASITK